MAGLLEFEPYMVGKTGPEGEQGSVVADADGRGDGLDWRGELHGVVLEFMGDGFEVEDAR